MVEVRTDDHIFLPELGITARQNTHDILGFRLRTSHANPRMHLHRQRKVWQWLISIESGQNFLKAVTAAREQHFSARRIEFNTYRQRRWDALTRVSQFHGWLETGRRNTRPRYFCAAGIRDGN